MSMFRSGAPEIPVAPVGHASEAAVDPAAVSLLDDPQEWLGFGRPCTPSSQALRWTQVPGQWPAPNLGFACGAGWNALRGLCPHH